jgi:hypothetical protein
MTAALALLVCGEASRGGSRGYVICCGAGAVTLLRLSLVAGCPARATGAGCRLLGSRSALVGASAPEDPSSVGRSNLPPGFGASRCLASADLLFGIPGTCARRRRRPLPPWWALCRACCATHASHASAAWPKVVKGPGPRRSGAARTEYFAQQQFGAFVSQRPDQAMYNRIPGL